MKNKKTLKKIFAAFALFALMFTTLLSAFPSTSKAMGLITITVKQPDPFSGNYSWFVYEKEGGSTIQDTATIKNVGTEPTMVNVYAVDATSNEAGSFILTFPEDSQNNIGIWTEIKSGPLQLNPQQSIDIPFKIHVPENVTPGQYTGGIIVENSSEQKETETDQKKLASPYLGSVASATDINTNDNISSGGTVSVKTRIGTRIYLTIPGEIVEDIKLTDITAIKDIGGITRFQFVITNNGNMTYEPHARIEIYDTLGNLYETIDETLGTSSPNTVIKPSAKMTKTPFFGNFSAKVTMTYPSQFNSKLHGAPLKDTSEIKFWIIPWEIILMITLLILTGFAIYIKNIYTKKAYEARSISYVVQPNDDLINLGKTHNVPWKKIAKFNDIKAPFIIKPGQTIKIPRINTQTKAK